MNYYFSDLRLVIESLDINFSDSSDPLILYVYGDLHATDAWKKTYQLYKSDERSNKYFIFMGDIISPKVKSSNRMDKLVKQNNDPRNLSSINDVFNAISNDDNTYLILGNHEVYELLSVYGKFPKSFQKYTSLPEELINDEVYVENLKKMTQELKSNIDANSSKIRTAMSFESKGIVLSHSVIYKNDISKVSLNDNITTAKLCRDPSNVIINMFGHGSNITKFDLSRLSKRWKYQIVGHYNGAISKNGRFPYIEDNEDITLICVDDTNSGSKRSLLIEIDDEDFKYKVLK